MSSPGNVIDLTAGGVQFASWRTTVENDDLHLVQLSYSSSDEVSFPQENFTLRLPPGQPSQERGRLTAVFFSKEQQAVVTFIFTDVTAFRVVDESGLLEIWEASSKRPRPARTTFRVRGHRWQDESFLAWINGTGDDHHYSLMIATDWECLEVVASEEPVIELHPAVITPYISTNLPER